MFHTQAKVELNTATVKKNVTPYVVQTCNSLVRIQYQMSREKEWERERETEQGRRMLNEITSGHFIGLMKFEDKLDYKLCAKSKKPTKCLFSLQKCSKYGTTEEEKGCPAASSLSECSIDTLAKANGNPHAKSKTDLVKCVVVQIRTLKKSSDSSQVWTVFKISRRKSINLPGSVNVCVCVRVRWMWKMKH